LDFEVLLYTSKMEAREREHVEMVFQQTSWGDVI